jgi:hypothetical protein
VLTSATIYNRIGNGGTHVTMRRVRLTIFAGKYYEVNLIVCP